MSKAVFYHPFLYFVPLNLIIYHYILKYYPFFGTFQSIQKCIFNFILLKNLLVNVLFLK